MNASLTQLRRQTNHVLRPVIQGGKKVTLTEHDRPVAEIVPKAPVDRVRAIKLLGAIGPVKLPSRQ